MNATFTAELLERIANQNETLAAAQDAEKHAILDEVIAGTSASPEDIIARCNAIGYSVEELHADVEAISAYRTDRERIAERRLKFNQRMAANRTHRENLTAEIKAFNQRMEQECRKQWLEEDDLRFISPRLIQDEHENTVTKAKLEARGFGRFVS